MEEGENKGGKIREGREKREGGENKGRKKIKRK